MGVNNILQIPRILLHEKPIILFLKKNILISVCMIKNVVGLAGFHSSKVKIITKADSSYRKTGFYKLQLFQSSKTLKKFFHKKNTPDCSGVASLAWFSKGYLFFNGAKTNLKGSTYYPGILSCT